MSFLALHECRPGEHPTWDALAAAQPHGGIFASSRWLAAMADALGMSPLLLTMQRGDKLVAGMPLMLRRRGLLTLSVPTPGALYNGLLIDPAASVDEARQACDALIEQAEKRCHFISASVSAASFAPAPFAERGWRVLEQTSILVDIGDNTKLHRQFSQSLRRKLRAAERLQLRYEPCDDTDEVLDLLQHSYTRHRLTLPFPREMLADWMRHMQREGLTRAHRVKTAAGATVAARVVVPADGVVYDWIAGADITASDIPASHWLVSRVLEDYGARDCHTFDFMGANTPGIMDFKKSFGGRVISYYVTTHHRTALVRTIERLRNAMRARRRSRR